MTAVETPIRSTHPGAQGARARWAGVSGLVFAALLVVSLPITSGMPSTSNPAKLQDWVVRHTGLLNAAFIVNALGAMAGLYFISWIYSQLAGSERGWMETMYITGTAVLGTAGAVSAGLDASLSTDAKHLSPASIQLLDSLMTNFNYPTLCIGLAVVYLSVGYMIRRSTLLPGWLAWVSWVFSFLAATIVFGFVALFGLVLWSITVAVILTARRRAES